MKKVLVYRSELLPPSETFIRQQLLACTSWTPVLAGQRRVEGLPLDGIDVCVTGPVPRFRQLLQSAPRAMTSRLRAQAPDLLHAHFGTDAVDFWPAAQRLRRPLLVTLHGYDINVQRSYWESGAQGLVRRLYPRRLIAMSHSPRVHLIAVSEAIRRSALDFGLCPERLWVRYIGVNRDEFAPTGPPMRERAQHVLFIGRLVEKKGLRHLIEAFARAQPQLPDARLLIAGEGPLRGELTTLAQQLRVPAQFLGQQTPAQIRLLLDQARLLCLPSVTAGNGDAEGLPMVLLEAQACGVPVLTSARGGTSEGLVPEITGAPFAEGDVAALAWLLSTLLPDHTRLQRMSHAAHHFIADRFDLRDCTRQLEALYDQINEEHLRAIEGRRAPAIAATTIPEGS